jgi:ketosteroid isomerase-like protein
VPDTARSGVTPRQVAERFIRAMVSQAPGDMADLYADRLVIEMPFFPPGLFPARVETGREELRARFAAGRADRIYTQAGNVVIHETADPEVVIVEYDLHGERLEPREAFTQSFILVLTIRDGLIVHSRDYTNPITGARMLGRLPELIKALTG